MKKLMMIALSALFMLGFACSGDSSKEKPAAQGKKVVLDTEDAMMAKLAEYKIAIPDGMVFRSVDKQTYLDADFEEADTYVINFDMTYEGGSKKDELLNWFDNQRTILKNNGWTETSYEPDTEMMGGGTYDTAIFRKESESCTLLLRVGFSEDGASIHVNPKYEKK